MEFRHLRYFLAVAEELHFARAAERLHIEQSPLSRAIRELEEELGAQLFVRTSRSTRLTLAGKLLMENAPRVLLALDQARESLVPESIGVTSQDPGGVAEVRQFTPGHYRVHYRCASSSLLRVSNSYYDGWGAASNGQRLNILPVDHALIGVVVPAGEGEVDLEYHSTYFLPGALVTLSSTLTCAALLWWRRRRAEGTEPAPATLGTRQEA